MGLNQIVRKDSLSECLINQSDLKGPCIPGMKNPHDAWNERSMAPMILKQVLIIYGDNNQN